MCVSCGCGEGLDDHGDAGNITAARKLEELTEADLKKAADAQGISVAEVLRNLEATRRK